GPERTGGRDVPAVDHGDAGAAARDHRTEPRTHEDAEGVHDGSADLARGLAGGEAHPRLTPAGARQVRGRGRLTAPLLIVLTLLEGCSVFALPPAPPWVPLLGRPEQGKVPDAPPVPAAKQPTAPLISVGQAAPVDPETVVDRV